MHSTAISSDQERSQWAHYLQSEADAAYLYDVLASLEGDGRRKDVFRRLAEVERRHVAMWRRVIAEHDGRGVSPDLPGPTARARGMAWLARRLGPGPIAGLMLREEGREVKGYLALSREGGAVTRSTARTLARESAEHAATLRAVVEAGEGEPWHRTESGGFLRNVVYGFNDGLTANFGLVAGVVGASVPSPVVLIAGIAGMIADALSMGASGYLAAKSEREVYEHEIALERDEIRIMPELEQEELALLYEAKGVDPERARKMAAEVMSDPERALEEKVRVELLIGEAHTTPLREGWITGSATAVGALIPVAPFFVWQGLTAIALSFSVSMLSHFGVGAGRSLFTGRGLVRSGFDMFVVGLGVAGVGYAVGELAARFLGS